MDIDKVTTFARPEHGLRCRVNSISRANARVFGDPSDAENFAPHDPSHDTAVLLQSTYEYDAAVYLSIARDILSPDVRSPAAAHEATQTYSTGFPYKRDIDGGEGESRKHNKLF